MKNSSKNRPEPVHIILFCLVFATIGLVRAERYSFTQRRASFFVLRGDFTEEVKVGSSGRIFLDHQKNPISRFKVIDIYRDQYLCRLENGSSEFDQTRITKISFKKPPAKKNKSGNLLEIRGIIFKPLTTGRDYFISLKPYPVNKINPLNLAEIKNILFDIERKSQNKYIASFLNWGHLQQLGLAQSLNFSRKDTLLLGTRDGKLGIIYSQNDEIHHSTISPDALKKFKDLLFFYIILKKGSS